MKTPDPWIWPNGQIKAADTRQKARIRDNLKESGGVFAPLIFVLSL